MARHRTMQRFARWHVWLGWLAGFPLLMWAVTGLFMVARPIEEVRGEHLRAPQPAIDPAGLVLPARIGEPILESRLVAQPARRPPGPRYRRSCAARRRRSPRRPMRATPGSRR
jgi:hypothetical protein